MSNDIVLCKIFLNVFISTYYYFTMEEPTDKEISDVFEKVNIVNEQRNKKKNDSFEFKTFEPKITAVTGHYKIISHKQPDNVASREVVKNSTVLNNDDEIIKDFISHILE